MDRRGFLGMIGGVAAGAAMRSWPFRVYSFPVDIKIQQPSWDWRFADGTAIAAESKHLDNLAEKAKHSARRY